jgi:AAA+ ATPase superfamily predicted ATPase
MEIDKNVVEQTLQQYGITLEELLYAAKHKTPKAEQDWIYLIHHLHQPKKAADMETVHHCFMYEKKNLKGKEHEQMHVKDGKVFQHCLKIDNLDEAPEIVYDHLNNAFKVSIREINKEKYAVITGPTKLSDIKWSDQDKGVII